MTRFNSILGKKNRIGKRLILLIVVCSSLITLSITLVQLVFDYRQQRGELDKLLDTVAVHLPSISGSVWALDQAQTELALKALVQMPTIERASVIISKPQRQWMAGVNKVSPHTLTKNFPLTYRVRGHDHVIGYLEIVASLDAIYLSVAKHALVIFLSNGLKTFIVVIFMYFAFRRIVTNRVERLARKVATLAPEILPEVPENGENAQKPLQGQEDELDAVDYAFDVMTQRLREAVDELNRINANLLVENGERQRAETALRKYQAQLEEQVRERASVIVEQKDRLQVALTEIQLIVENASLGILNVVVRADGRRTIRHPNRAFASMLGYTADELDGSDARSLYPGNGAEMIAAVYRESLSKGESHRGEYRLRRKDGELIDVWMVGTAIDPDDLSKGTIWMVDDISARKKAEYALAEAKEVAERALVEQGQANRELNRTLEVLRETQGELIEREKLAALGALVAGVAHELGSPIGNSLMSASTLAEMTSEMSEKFKTGLKRSTLATYLEAVGRSNEIVIRNMNRAAELVDSFRKVAVDQGSSMRRPFLLDEIVSEIVLVMHPTIKKTPYVIDCNLPEKIEMDSFPGPLGQVLANLINNALIHGFEGCDHGTVHIEARPLNTEQIELQVRDDGMGIAKANLARIFEPFFSTRLGEGGSGLGLGIVQTLVTGVLGGKISVSSEEGRGTTFTMVLPKVAPAQVEKVAEPA